MSRQKILEKFFSKKAGKKRSLIETKNFAQGLKTALPVLTIRGKKAEQTAVVLAGQHGRELNGIASIEKVFNKLDPEKISGQVVFLPVMNPPGVRLRYQDYPSEIGRNAGKFADMPESEFNINRTWLRPYIPNNYACEVSSLVWESFVQHACAVVDFHGWSGSNISLSMANFKNKEFSRKFGLPWCWILQDKTEKNNNFMLRDAADEAGIPSITCELSPSNILDPESVAHGERCIYNLLIQCNMLEGELSFPDIQYEFHFDSRHDLIVSPVEGLVVTDLKKGDIVRKGETVLRILSLDSLKTAWEYKSPVDSFVYGIGDVNEFGNRYSVTHPGQMPGILVRPESFAVKIKNKSGRIEQKWMDFTIKNLDALEAIKRKNK